MKNEGWVESFIILYLIRGISLHTKKMLNVDEELLALFFYYFEVFMPFLVRETTVFFYYYFLNRHK